MAAKKRTTKKTEIKTGNDNFSEENVNGSPQFGKLRRSETDKVVAGVAGGIGRFFNIDSTIIRLIFILLTVFGGGGILLYIVLWLIMPSENSTSKSTEEAIEENKADIKMKARHAADNIKYESRDSSSNKSTFAIILVILGIYFLLSNLGFFRFIDLSKFWPLILIIIGIVILMKNE